MTNFFKKWIKVRCKTCGNTFTFESTDEVKPVPNCKSCGNREYEELRFSFVLQSKKGCECHVCQNTNEEFDYNLIKNILKKHGEKIVTRETVVDIVDKVVVEVLSKLNIVVE